MAVHGFGPGKNKVLVVSMEDFADEVGDVVNPLLSAKQAQHTHPAGTLVAANWEATTGGYTQTINMTGVTTSNTVIVSAAPANLQEYGASGIYATAQGTGTLTFFAQYLPTNNLIVNAVVLGV